MYLGNVKNNLIDQIESLDELYRVDRLFAEIMGSPQNSIDRVINSLKDDSIIDKLEVILPPNISLERNYSIFCPKCYQYIGKDEDKDVKSMFEDECYCNECKTYIPIKDALIDCLINIHTEDDSSLPDDLFFEDPLFDPDHIEIENHFGQPIYRTEIQRNYAIQMGEDKAHFQYELDMFFSQKMYSQLDDLTSSLLRAATIGLGIIPESENENQFLLIDSYSINTFYSIYFQALENELKIKFFKPLKDFIVKNGLLKELVPKMCSKKKHKKNSNNTERLLYSYLMEKKRLNIIDIIQIFKEFHEDKIELEHYSSQIFQLLSQNFLTEKLRRYIYWILIIKDIIISIYNDLQKNKPILCEKHPIPFFMILFFLFNLDLSKEKETNQFREVSKFIN